MNLLIIGITGGIGSGKSTVAHALEKYGARLILADDMAKEIMKPGMLAYQQIVSAFGTRILDQDGGINRKRLAKIVFDNNHKLNILNRITHGIVAKKIKNKLIELRKENTKLVAVEAVVPIQNGFLDLVDTVWLVVAPEDIRIERIISRNGTTKTEAKQRIHSQMPDDVYKSIADKVIYNSGSVAELEAKVWEELKNEDYSVS